MTTDFAALSTCLLLKIQVGIQLPLQEGECAGLLASIVKQWGIRACGYHFIWGGRPREAQILLTLTLLQRGRTSFHHGIHELRETRRVDLRKGFP